MCVLCYRFGYFICTAIFRTVNLPKLNIDGSICILNESVRSF